MTNERGTNGWLEAARADVARRAPDPMVESQLLGRVRERRALRSMAAVRPVPDRRPRPVRRTWLVIGLPVAFAAVMVVLIATRLLAPVVPDGPAGAVATPFIALVGHEALAAERAPVVVSSQVDRAVLADYGLPVDPARADEPLAAEFLVSRAGVVLAVRFID